MEAEKEKIESEMDHQNKMASFAEEEASVKKLYKELKKHISKSRLRFYQTTKNDSEACIFSSSILSSVFADRILSSKHDR